MITTLIDNMYFILFNICRHLPLLFMGTTIIESFIEQFHNMNQLQHLVL